MKRENKFPESLIVTNVKEPVIRDILESKWMKWWDSAESFDSDNTIDD